MTVAEPRAVRVASQGKHPNRWRWWYSSIADWMIRNPGGTIVDCAKELNKHANTIGFIMKTDLFQDYFAARRAEWIRDHDFELRNKLTKVASLTLDATAEKLEKQRDKIDLPLLTDLLSSSLDRLGFAPAAVPSVQINQIGDNRTQVQLPGSVTASDLEEARMVLRAVQAGYTAPRLVTSTEGGSGTYASPVEDRSGTYLGPDPGSVIDVSASGAGPESRQPLDANED